MPETVVKKQEYTFVNRRPFVSTYPPKEIRPNPPQEIVCAEVAKPKQTAARLQGKRFVWLFQAMLCVLLFLLIYGLISLKPSFGERLLRGFQRFTETDSVTVADYFTPIETEDTMATRTASEANDAKGE